jgi:outer membrane protein assembly factor BamE (lipoprotein component of BamABCDE complex)
MKILLSIILLIILQNCSLNKVVHHHGVHNLEKKQEKLKINQSNKNDITKLIGPPSTKSTFDNDIYIYIEKKTSSSKLTKLGAKSLLINNVLVLEINDKGLLISKKLYTKNDMTQIKFDENSTTTDLSKESFINRFLFSLRQKIDDPLGKKRSSN